MDRSIEQAQKWNSTRANDRFCIWDRVMLNRSINSGRTGQVAALGKGAWGAGEKKWFSMSQQVSPGSQEDKQCPGLPDKLSEN